MPRVRLIIFIFFSLAFFLIPVLGSQIPTIDTISPGQQSITNGGEIRVTVSGSCGVPVTQAWYHLQKPDGVTLTASFPVTTSGNTWSGQVVHQISPQANSGQYVIHRISIQDNVGTYVYKDCNVIFSVDNSNAASTPTIDTISPGQQSITNGGEIRVTVSGSCGVPVTQAWYHLQKPDGVTLTASFPVTTSGNTWSGQVVHQISPQANSGQYAIHRISIQDNVGTYVYKDCNVIFSVDNPFFLPSTTLQPTYSLVSYPTTTITNTKTYQPTISQISTNPTFQTISTPVSQVITIHSPATIPTSSKQDTITPTITNLKDAEIQTIQKAPYQEPTNDFFTQLLVIFNDFFSNIQKIFMI